MAGSDLITEARIVELGLTPGEIRLAVRQAIEQRADGRATLVGKVGLYPRSGGLFHAMPGALEDLVALKWLVAGGQPRPGDPELKSTILATDPLTGDLLGIMDAGYLTGLRTAAITALALELLVPRREIRL